MAFYHLSFPPCLQFALAGLALLAALLLHPDDSPLCCLPCPTRLPYLMFYPSALPDVLPACPTRLIHPPVLPACSTRLSYSMFYPPALPGVLPDVLPACPTQCPT